MKGVEESWILWILVAVAIISILFVVTHFSLGLQTGLGGGPL